MEKIRSEVTPPAQPVAAEQPAVCGLDGWIPRENPHEGRFVDEDPCDCDDSSHKE